MLRTKISDSSTSSVPTTRARGLDEVSGEVKRGPAKPVRSLLSFSAFHFPGEANRDVVSAGSNDLELHEQTIRVLSRRVCLSVSALSV